MIIQLMGPQACGKGTQGELLSNKLGIPLIGVGDLLRHITSSHRHYALIQETMDKGDLVPDQIVADLLVERISHPDCKNGYIMDGYTRDVHQLDYFDPHPDWVIMINIPREESIRRISGRRICEANGEIYNIYTLPKEELAKCPGPLTQRDDDKEEAVNRRLDIYYTQTTKVLDYYRGLGRLIEIDGVGTPERVFSRILEALEASETSKRQ